jgi:hypothetical protein
VHYPGIGTDTLLNMATPRRTRAKGAELPSWFMDKVRDIADERKASMGESLGELAALLTEAVAREPAWDHSSVSRFLSEETLTITMATAFSRVFGIPEPFYVPKSFDEALSMQQVSRRYEGKAITPEQQRRLALVDAHATQAKVDAEGQTGRVTSRDEGTSRRGRPRRTSRGRSSAS